MKGSTSNRFSIPVTASVRLRLTLWYLAVMSLIIFVFGGSLYGSSQTFLNGDTAESQLQAQLYQDSQQYTATYRKALIAHQPLTSPPLREQELIVLLGPTGRVMTASGPLTTGVIDQLQMRSAQFSGLLDVELPETHPQGLWKWSTTNEYRILVTPVLNQNARIATLLVGLPQPAPTPLLAIWLFWGTMALLVAAVGGYWLAGKVLRPVNAITHMANEIEATDLRRRLHIERRDEFGELAATFNHMLGRLEAAFRRQAQLTADASHELRTPLTIMNLEINRALTQLSEPEEYRQVLEQINVENAQMMAMVNGLLLLARADTGKLVLEQCDVDLGDVALASVERLLPLARRSGVALATGELPELIVRGDPQYLGQMLTNLIENGIKYSTGAAAGSGSTWHVTARMSRLSGSRITGQVSPRSTCRISSSASIELIRHVPASPGIRRKASMGLRSTPAELGWDSPSSSGSWQHTEVTCTWRALLAAAHSSKCVCR